MLISVAYILLGIALLYLGAHWLVTGSARLAKHLGIRPLIIGLTIVAFGTSAPELFSSLVAQLLLHSGSVAVGNVVGSNIYNIGLVLGVSALICPMAIQASVIRRELVVCVLVSFMLWFYMWTTHISRPEGFTLLLGMVAYILFQLYQAHQSRDKAEEILSGEYAEAVEEKKPHSLWFHIFYIFIGCIGLALGAHLLVVNAVDIGHMLGISDRVIGLTAVAIGTSLPELATAIMAATKKHTDLVLGNVIGSNIFNVLLIIGAVAAIEPLTFDPRLLRVDVPVMLAVTLLMAILLISGRTLKRWEGTLLLTTSVAYTVWLYF